MKTARSTPDEGISSAPLDAIEFCFDAGYTDGLPVVPPTEENVATMLRGVRREPQEIIARIPPAFAEATVEKIAINAVMAGCKPEYLPVVIAGVRAMADAKFNLQGVQGTTDMATPLFIVNGPIRHRLEINSGWNVFGQGWRANATIGRALHLIMWNLGGAKPGEIDKSTLGNPGRFAFLIAEWEEQSPWDPLHVERGFSPEQSTVTAHAADGMHCISDHSSRCSDELAASIGRSAACLINADATLLGETVFVVSPEHAKTFAEDNWGKDRFRAHLLDAASSFGHRSDRTSNETDCGECCNRLPKFRGPEKIVPIVAGGTAGRFTACLPGWGYGRSEMVTVAVGDCSIVQ